MTDDHETFRGQCHCGGVKFSLELPEGVRDVVRCNCSICRMRGAVMVFSALGGLSITKGADMLSAYQFNSNIAKHYFCSKCGIFTHHQRRFDPSQYAVNVACLTDMSPFDFIEVPVVDGAHHPADLGGGPLQIAGMLRFEPAQP